MSETTRFEYLMQKLLNGERVDSEGALSRGEEHLIACINRTGVESLGAPRCIAEVLLQELAVQLQNDTDAKPEQTKTVTPTTSTQTVLPDSGYALSKVTVNAIPSNYIIPSGSVTITANGTHDVTSKASVVVNVPTPEPTLQDKTVTANGSVTADDDYDGLGTVTVNVPVPDGYIQPSGSLTVTTNGTHDVTSKASVVVNVPIPDGYIQPSGSLTITENGTHDVTSKASVTVNVPTYISVETADDLPTTADENTIALIESDQSVQKFTSGAWSSYFTTSAE